MRFYYVFCFIMSSLNAHPHVEMNKLVSHDKNIKIDINKEAERINKIENPTLPHKDLHNILQQLDELQVGRFLMKNKGLDGYWTAYIILHGPKKRHPNSLHKWLIHKAPVVLATRERFYIFQKELQKLVKPGITMASMPCGLMDDLLRLNLPKEKDIKLVGIDLDENSLTLAKANALNHHLNTQSSFLKRDAWKLKIEEEFDVLTSNGLNIYVHDDAKVFTLYQEFYKALKPGGTLITSFLTPPPTLDKNSPWRNYSKDDVQKQKAVFSDVLQVHWQAFRTEARTREQLKEAGFTVEKIIWDKQRIFPTVVAKKPASPLH